MNSRLPLLLVLSGTILAMIFIPKAASRSINDEQTQTSHRQLLVEPRIYLEPHHSIALPAQAPEDIAGIYGGIAGGSSSDCDFLNPISEPVQVELNPPTIDNSGIRKLTGLVSVGDVGTGKLTADLSDPGDVRSLTNGTLDFGATGHGSFTAQWLRGNPDKLILNYSGVGTFFFTCQIAGVLNSKRLSAPLTFSSGILSNPAGALDPQVEAVQQAGQFKITPRSDTPGQHFNGFVSDQVVDITNKGGLGIEAIQTANDGGETIFALAKDANNFYRFKQVDLSSPPAAALAASLGLPLDATGSYLIFEVKIAGNIQQYNIPYDSELHRYWRFYPSQVGIDFQTSPDQSDWTTQKSVPIDLSVTQGSHAELSAGTSTSVPFPGSAVLQILPPGVIASAPVVPTATPTPTSTSTPSPTPSPTPPFSCANGNKIRDSGFEATDMLLENSFWDSSSTQFDTALCNYLRCGTGNGTAGPRTGDFWAWLGGRTGPETSSVTQIVRIPSGANSTLNYYLRIGSVAAPFTDVMNVKVDGVIVQSIAEPTVPELVYNLHSVSLNSFADDSQHTILFEYVSPKDGGGANFSLDDVSIDVSCPATISTSTGSNVTVQSNGATITFANVTTAGGTVVAPLAPTSAGQLPTGYALFNGSVAFDISTTAIVQPPISVCLNASSVTDQAAFAKLRLLHRENGILTDRTISNIFATKMVCANVDSLSPFVLATTTAQQIQFNSTSYNVSEATGFVTINVSRLGDNSGLASINYATNDASGQSPCASVTGKASGRCDYEVVAGTLQFATGESNKSVTILIVNDSYAEGNESLTLDLSNPSGTALGQQNTATITIADDELSNQSNPIDRADFFVTNHYYDFLSRLPDSSGLSFWTNEINSCGADSSCVDLKRVTVSAAYFISIEFQQTGYLVERTYKTAYGDANGTSTFNGPHQLPVPTVRFSEFLADTQEIAQGLVVGQPGWETVLENNKQRFAAEFVQRAGFASTYLTTLTPAQFVDNLFHNAGVTPSTAERNDAIMEFGGASNTSDQLARGRALRRVAENSTLNTQEFNRAFVLMQFYGYLRRNPNDTPDADYSGYDFWLTKLDQFNGNYVNAEMVKAFINSSEYRSRFGP